MKFTLTTVIAVTALAIIGVFSFIRWQDALNQILGTPIYEKTYQFLLFIIIGGAITGLYKQFTMEQERREKKRTRDEERHNYIRQFIKEIWMETDALYKQTLKINFVSRATLFDINPYKNKNVCVLADPYKQFSSDLYEVISGLELLEQRIKAHADLFSNSTLLINTIGEMQNYLFIRFDEYTKSIWKFTGEPGKLSSDELPYLMEFFGFSSKIHTNAQWHNYFKGNYYQATELLKSLVFEGMD
jgi:hypothetical protein